MRSPTYQTAVTLLLIGVFAGSCAGAPTTRTVADSTHLHKKQIRAVMKRVAD